MVKYDGMIVLSHFKGHPMGGYGGALKQLQLVVHHLMEKRISMELVNLKKFGQQSMIYF